MRCTTTQAVCRALAVLSLVAAGLWSPSLASASTAALPAPTTQSYAGPCTDDLGVTVVVDFQALGGSTVVRCAPGSGGQPFQGTGLDAMQAAGVQVAGTSQEGLTVVCRVNGRPAADEELSIPGDDAYTEQCVQMPPPTAFWSYWQADNGGDWTFSNWGVTSSTARAGGFEGFSFSLNTSHIKPRTAPSRPSPEPPPAQEPEPTPPPSQEPAPTTPPSQEPSPSPTPAPQPSQPAPSTPPSQPEPPTPPRETTPGPDQPSPSARGTDGAGQDEGSAVTDPTTEEAGESAPEGADLGEVAAGQVDNGADAAAGTAEGDAEDSTEAPATPADQASASAVSTPTDEPSADAASEQFTPEESDGSNGATALWVTFAILLLLGGLGVVASRRRRDPGITHQVEP